ncbi:MAG: TonB-dependent receptor, partial [Steroidobacteraceae bacterium]
LRGPQGSLFGSASMGGAVNYVANVADPSDFASRVETTIGKTRGADVGYTAKAMLSAPLVQDKLAVRGVFSYRSDPGYLDNEGIGRDDSSDITIAGGRLSAVWAATAGTQLSWLSLYQKTDADDAPYRNPAVGELARSTAIIEPNETDVQIHSLRLDQDVSFGTLTALGAYHEKTQDFVFDFTPFRIFYNADLGLNLTTPLYIGSGGESKGESIELRLASGESDSFEWLVGAMYFRSDKDLYEQIGAQGAAAAFDASPLFGPGSGATIAPGGEIFNAFYSTVEGKESAVFGEASWHFADRWTLTAGGRVYKNEVESTTTQVGFSTYPGDPIVTATADEEDGFSPKLSLSYRPGDDFMVYGLYSEGFRFGTPNIQGLSTFPIPAGSKSDSLKNYEIGVRTNWLDDALLLDATVFYVDWKDIQLRLQTPDFFNYAANGGAAEIKGIETSITLRPMERFDWQSSVTYMEARLSEPLFILFGGT